ncbi:MAG: EF-hand domain-containing protein [Aureliella sp.]
MSKANNRHVVKVSKRHFGVGPEGTFGPASSSMSRVVLLCVFWSLFVAGCSNKNDDPQPTAEITKGKASEPGLEGEPGPDAAVDETMIPAEDAADSGTAGAERGLAEAGLEADTVADSDLPEHWATANWTRKRLVALAASGPVVLDLRVSVGGQALEEASAGMAADIWEELFVKPEAEAKRAEGEGEENEFASKGLKWEDVLEHPVVQSGWLGNLVPDDQQEDQIFSMYDDGDRKVTLAEFQNFLSRGLSRRSALLVSDVGAEDGANIGDSPWGDLDQNEDSVVDLDEQSMIAKALEKYDFNADSIVSLQELNQPSSTAQAGTSMQYSSMIDVNTLYIADGLFTDDAAERLKEERALAERILKHYTFLEGIERAQWSSWSDARWDELDANGDGLLNKTELVEMGKQGPECCLAIYLSPAQELVEDVAAEGVEMAGRSTQAPSRRTTLSQVLATQFAGEDVEQQAPGWVAAGEGGRLVVGGLVLQVDVEDVYGSANADLLRQRLEMALTNEQFADFARNQLQLQEDGFDLIDEDDDDKLSDEEFRRVWRWLTARQSARAIGRWMTVKHPWFQLLDESGDKKLSQKELADGAAIISKLDADMDGAVASNEMPMLVRFEMNRSDNRLDFNVLGLPQTEQAEMPADWFAAMDTNQDGFLSKLEFLGEIDDFSALDADNDGFISRKEVY